MAVVNHGQEKIGLSPSYLFADLSLFIFFLLLTDLQPDFRRLPESTRAVVGEPARFHCLPPKGQPEPEVTWRKNGVPIAWDDELALDKERYHRPVRRHSL